MLAALLFGGFLVCGSGASALTKVANCHPGWEQQSRPPANTQIRLHIAVKQADDGGAVVQHLLAASDPAGSSFRQYQNPTVIADLSAPSDGAVELVGSWLRDHDLYHLASLSLGIYAVDTTVAKAESLLNTTYYAYADSSQRTIIRAESYTLDSDIAKNIDFVTPTTAFPRASLKDPETAFNDQDPEDSRHFATSRRSSCSANDQVTPTCLRQAYNITYQAQPNRTIFAVYGTEGATYSAKDTSSYLVQYNAPAASASAQYTVIGSGAANESSGIDAAFETSLDTQTLLGLAWPASGILYRNGGVFGPNPGQVYDNFVQFLQELATNASVPTVVSFSESMPEDMVDPSYARRLCSMMAAVGARGTTLLFSSGDNGPNGDQPSGTHNKIFEVEFPASCPWVTSVGGTTDLANETAATGSTIGLFDKLSYQASGGGFSNLFSTPQYQAGDVPAYISAQVPQSYFTGAPANGFNASGRGVPDISAFSTNVPATVSGFTVGIAGTSASTPIWAAIVTLLNDYEAAHGRPSLGFLNPWLYNISATTAHEPALKDISTGGNSAGACYLLSGCTLPYTLGYNVSPGWDAVTGLGSPLFGGLLAALDRRAAS